MPDKSHNNNNSRSTNAHTHKQQPAESIVDDTTQDDNSPTAKIKKKLYKRPWFWVTLALSIVGIGIIIFLSIYSMAQNSNKQIITNGWSDIIKKANTLNTLADKVEDRASFDTYNSELQKLDTTISDKKSATQNLKYKAQDAQLYENFLSDFNKYTQASLEYSNKIIDYTKENSDSLKDLSATAKDSSDKLKDNTKYLSDSMPAQVFSIQDTLSKANKAILAVELSTKTLELATQAQTAKDIADKKAVEVDTNNYLNAFIAGNAATMRRYMTDAYQREYDFNQLTPASRASSYPASYRILTNQKVDQAQYKLEVNMLFKFRDGSGQYIVGYGMNMVYNASSASWLVDSVKEGSGF